ncbi:hypothetical protein [Cytophaga aurantiaca]|uniref:hypothetical protein n=1 Tax=Cytophaga aurantiaca TaxID=29530 RepID=UPI00039E08FB|nr:hypothetical protein [Cytophaga aurantiaca]
MKTLILFLLLSHCLFSLGQQTSLERSGYRGNVKQIITIKDSVLVSKLTYDVQGNLIEEIDFSDSTITKYINTYQGKNLVTKESERITDGRSYFSKITYTNQGKEIVEYYGDTSQSHVEILRYDLHSNMIEKSIYENGVRRRRIENTYNDKNRLIKLVITQKDSTLSQVTTFKYNDAGYLIESHTQTNSSQTGFISRSDYYYETVIEKDRVQLYFNDSLGNNITQKKMESIRSGDMYGAIQQTLKKLESVHANRFDKKGRPVFYFYTESEKSSGNYRIELNYNKEGMIDEITVNKNSYDETYFQYCKENKLKILYEKKKMVGAISYFNGVKTEEETYINSYNSKKQLDTLSIIKGKRQYGYSFKYWKNGELKELKSYHKGEVGPNTIKQYNSDGLLEYDFNQSYVTIYKYDSRGNCIYMKRTSVHYPENVYEEITQIEYY